MAGALLLVLVASLLPCTAQPDGSASAEDVEAAYLYRFIGYVDWPPDAFDGPGAPFVIGVVGADAVLASLTELVRGRRQRGREIVARGLAPGDPLDGVHMLFVPGDTGASREWLGRAAQRPVLVVTRTPAGLAGGGVINFMVVDQRIRFEASLPAARRQGLKLSARLLSVAVRVQDKP